MSAYAGCDGNRSALMGEPAYVSAPTLRWNDSATNRKLKSLPGFVRHFQKPFRLRAHDIAGQIGADRDRLFPGSFGTFKCRLNAGRVGKLTPAYLKAISRHA